MALSISFSVCRRVSVMSLVSMPRLRCEPRAREVSGGSAPRARFPPSDSIERRKLRGGLRLHRADRGVAVLARALCAVEGAVGAVNEIFGSFHVVRRVVRQAEAGGHPAHLARVVLEPAFGDGAEEPFAHP